LTMLITGARGFVGRNLARYFSGKGYPVLAPVRQELDLRDGEAVMRYIRAHAVDCVVHCATTTRKGADYPASTCEDNLRMFFNIERSLNPSNRFINLGSGSEYDRRHWRRKMREDFFDSFVPEDGHSYSKYVMARHISEARSGNAVHLRLFGVFGMYEDYRYRFFSNAIVKNMLGLPIVINQNVVYDYLYIDDFCRIVEFFVRNTASRRVYNVTPTQSTDLLTIASTVNGIGERKSEIRVLNEGIGVEYSGDNSALLADLGAFDFTDLRTAATELRAYCMSIPIDAEAVAKDDYLEYARRLKREYFRN
jgi:UDP-glucose 4-epimerase